MSRVIIDEDVLNSYITDANKYRESVIERIQETVVDLSKIITDADRFKEPHETKPASYFNGISTVKLVEDSVESIRQDKPKQRRISRQQRKLERRGKKILEAFDSGVSVRKLCKYNEVSFPTLRKFLVANDRGIRKAGNS